MNHDANIFFKICDNLPPILETELAEKVRSARLAFESDAADDDGEGMIELGISLWPWRRAHRDFLVEAEEANGRHFLLPRLSESLRDKCCDYLEHDMSANTLYAGGSAECFTPEERQELVAVLPEWKNDLREYANREISGLEKKRFLDKVENYYLELKAVEESLLELKKLAEEIEDNNRVHGEVHARLNYFQEGLAGLGPEPRVDEIHRAAEMLRGRVEELNRMRGIV